MQKLARVACLRVVRMLRGTGLSAARHTRDDKERENANQQNTKGHVLLVCSEEVRHLKPQAGAVISRSRRSHSAPAAGLPRAARTCNPSASCPRASDGTARCDGSDRPACARTQPPAPPPDELAPTQDPCRRS